MQKKQYICRQKAICRMNTFLIILVGIVFVAWFLYLLVKDYLPHSVWGWISFCLLTIWLTPVVTFPIQWVIGKINHTQTWNTDPPKSGL